MSHVVTAGAAFLPQVYRNTRTATRKRRAAPQLPSKLVPLVMSYVPEQCPFITNDAKRCGASFKYRNQLNQQPMDCSGYCLYNSAVWLSSLLQDLAQTEYISFMIPSLHRKYHSEYILHPIIFKAGINLEIEIDLNLDTTAEEIDTYVLNASPFVDQRDEFAVDISIQFSEYQYEEDIESDNEGKQDEDEYLHSIIIPYGSIPVQITDSFFTTSIFRHFEWEGSFNRFTGVFALHGNYSRQPRS